MKQFGALLEMTWNRKQGCSPAEMPVLFLLMLVPDLEKLMYCTLPKPPPTRGWTTPHRDPLSSPPQQVLWAHTSNSMAIGYFSSSMLKPIAFMSRDKGLSMGIKISF
mmetsp:Transcript_9457/g.40929  ORF Transcript_9457/g.40929 Transcript_9457/m.40929 type:complete len:107 (+) Transcript_9457:1582-1902(+)